MTKLLLATLMLLAALAPAQAQTICTYVGGYMTICDAGPKVPSVICIDMGNGMTVCN